MALINKCIDCGRPTTSDYGASRCGGCTKKLEEKKRETLRWNGLPVDKKVEEIKNRLDKLEKLLGGD